MQRLPLAPWQLAAIAWRLLLMAQVQQRQGLLLARLEQLKRKTAQLGRVERLSAYLALCFEGSKRLRHVQSFD
jgi:hypothetical protein